MNIREVAERTGLSAHTIRFYEKNGLLPKIRRSESGIRQFSEADITFLKFVSALKKTGMSLEDIAKFTQDGCILERLQTGEMPILSVSKRMSILQKHKNQLIEQRKEIELLIDAVNQKLNFYQEYLAHQSVQGRNEDQ